MEKVKLELEESMDEGVEVDRDYCLIKQETYCNLDLNKNAVLSPENDSFISQEFEDSKSIIETSDVNIGIEDCVRCVDKKYIDHENIDYNEDVTWQDKHHVISTSKQHRMNGQLKGEKLQCKLCDFNTENSIQLKAHLKGVHGQFEFQCHICHYSNPLEFCLKRHLALEHPDKIELKCSRCDYSTYRKSNLEDHMNDVHLKFINDINHGLGYNNDETKNCNHLATSVSKHQLMNGNLKDDKIKCEFCDYDTENSLKLEQHMKTIHPEFDTLAAVDCEKLQVKCLLCNYSSNRKYALRTHLNEVHLKLKNFKCDFCNFRTSRKHSLKLHINSIHLKMQKYQCQFCDFSTNHIIRFKFHRRAHLRIEPYNL